MMFRQLFSCHCLRRKPDKLPKHAVSDLISIRQLLVSLLPLLFTPNMITVILFTICSLSLNYLVSSRSRAALLLVLSLKLLRPVISLPSYAVSTGSESLNASNISSCHVQRSDSHPTSVVRNVISRRLAVLAFHLLLLLLGHQHYPL